MIPLALTAACKKDEGAKPSATESKSPHRHEGSEETRPRTETKPAAENARFEIKVTGKGFEPAETSVLGKPVTLVFERKTDEEHQGSRADAG